MTGAERLLALVLPLAPLPIGVPFARRRWPAHVTALSNFLTRLDDEQVREVVDPVLTGFGPVEGRIGEDAMFGPAFDIPVRLVESPEVLDLHAALLAAVRPIAGFERPTHQGPGYRPHVTLVPGEALATGSMLHLPDIALAEMRGPDATVLWSRPL